MGARTQDVRGVDLEQQLETEWFYIEGQSGRDWWKPR